MGELPFTSHSEVSGHHLHISFGGRLLCLEGRHLRTHLYRHRYKHEQVQEDGLLTPAKPRRRLETSSLGKQPSHDSACAATTEQRPSRRGCSEPLLVLEAAAWACFWRLCSWLMGSMVNCPPFRILGNIQLISDFCFCLESVLHVNSHQ